MPDKNQNILTVKEQIDVLLKEYDTLRSEIINRMNSGVQIGVVAVGVVTFLASRQSNQASIWVVVVPTTGIVIFSLVLWRDLYSASRRVAELEREINHLAGRALLKWESQWSTGSKGVFGWLTDWKIKKKQKKTN